MENWCLDSFGDIGGIDRGASVWRKSGESNLVVDDHVHGSPGAVCAQLGHLQRFQDNALTSHRGITVNQHGQHTESTNFFSVLLGADNAFEDTVDSFEVRGVRCQIHGDAATAR